ncbi:DUF3566 domain-containing protein [Nocardia sp. alder85J]|uniref:DUF3566 domain-containing protein n=1 Tax=Nocardia sp. alder85J TaxID=2862949 RepID=UPI001CD4D344|nr:DUF3566 domain-containing protein [Nocardia sp. alder85J]MCX4096531.1 DUF3566 domain-containing protein [Nocardia sp. alder85J]
MTTPNQPNDDRHHANGVTERVAPSPIPPRPIPRPASGEGGPGSAAENSATEKLDKTLDIGEPGGSGPKADGGNGSSQLPQREPQSNLNRPGHVPVTGGRSVGLNAGVSNARTTADLAAKAARKEAAMVKSVGIDGPTRSIARPELIKDMPDLSELRHPLPTAPAAAPQPGLPMAPVPPPVAAPLLDATGPQQRISPTAPAAVAQAAVTGEPLRATVQVRHIDPWSTLKVSLVISVAMFFVWMLAVGFLYIVLSGMGVWDRINTFTTDMVSDSGSSSLIGAGSVFGYAAVIGLINVVLITALSTIGVFIYNQCTDLVGGIQVTLADPD